jgi:hypothetical protein
MLDCLENFAEKTLPEPPPPSFVSISYNLELADTIAAISIKIPSL